MSTHQAAVYHSQGQPFEVRSQHTQKPGPEELLIAVKSVAMNPADAIMRDTGLFVSSFPTVIGFDFSGLVIDVGSEVPRQILESNSRLAFEPGKTRVAGYAASFWRKFNAKFGAFQERVVIPWQHAIVLPDEVSWNHAATLPVSVQVPLRAWDALGFGSGGTLAAPSSTDSRTASGDLSKPSRPKNLVLLVWGASSSVGTMGVQSARLLKDDSASPVAAVYATAGANNHEYVVSLGADRAFDYEDQDVVDSIVKSAKQAGFVIRHCFLAMGDVALCQGVLNAFLDDSVVEKPAKIASAPPVPPQAAEFSSIETIFLQPAAIEQDRLEQFRYYFGSWATENLAKGSIRPSPEPRVVGTGFQALNNGINMVARGVSCAKLVVQLGEEEEKERGQLAT